MGSLSFLEEVEAELAWHRVFGDCRYIIAQCQACYERRLRKISTHVPAAGQFLGSLSKATEEERIPVLGDTVVRCAIQHALRQVETGDEYGFSAAKCAEVFRLASLHLEEHRPGGPLAAGISDIQRLGSESYHGWIWLEDHNDDIFGECFRDLIQQNYDGRLCTPNAQELATLKKGAQLLTELAPSLARSALSHAHVIAVFPATGNWRFKASSSQYRISGTIFLNREALRSPWWVAEHLLHESLHQKLYDFRHGHSLLARDAVPDWDPLSEDGVKICSLWNMPDVQRSNYWDTHRSVAAFHVYVHLALLCTLAEIREPEFVPIYGQRGQFLAMTERSKAIERAHYLGEKIREQCKADLGFAGETLIDWLGSVLDSFAPFPPPNGPYTHLLLDRYMREAAKVQAMIEPESPEIRSEDLFRDLGKLVQTEVETTREALSSISAGEALSEFDHAIAEYRTEKLGEEFPRVRTLISRTLMDAAVCPSQAEMRSGSANRNLACHALLSSTMEKSSESLNLILSHQEVATAPI